MKFVKDKWIWIAGIIVSVLFLWTRFHNIEQSFFLWNDMGRDLVALQDWVATRKPPLLGPQTSALPINQSPIYFYMLMPVYFLMNGSPFSLPVTNAALYLATFWFGMYALRNNKKLQAGILVVFYLITINLQYLNQSRFIWNPSFVSPLLLASLISVYLLVEKFNIKRLAIFSLSLAIAVSLSYSVAPALIAINIYLLWMLKKHWLAIVGSQFVALLLVNLPTLLFEIRHKFLLTSSLFSRGASPQKAADITLLAKYNNLFGYGLFMNGWPLIAVTILILALVLWSLYRKPSKEFKLFSTIMGLTLLITFLVPLTIHSHYIFGFTCLLFLMIAFMPKVPKLTLLVVFSLFYMQPSKLYSFFAHAPRTVSDMDSCFISVCNDFKQPIFTSVQSSFHPYHNGPEFLYMLRRNGCNAFDISKSPDSANYMAVVLDGDTSYEEGKTGYLELTMFGKSKEIKRYSCLPNFGVVILQKQSTLAVPKDK